jgi:hypothetical protein
MGMVGVLDLHRGQITFDVVDADSGEVWPGTDLATGPGPTPAAVARRAGERGSHPLLRSRP